MKNVHGRGHLKVRLSAYVSDGLDLRASDASLNNRSAGHSAMLGCQTVEQMSQPKVPSVAWAYESTKKFLPSALLSTDDITASEFHFVCCPAIG